jgi:hypothetical protein
MGEGLGGAGGHPLAPPLNVEASRVFQKFLLAGEEICGSVSTVRNTLRREAGTGSVKPSPQKSQTTDIC